MPRLNSNLVADFPVAVVHSSSYSRCFQKTLTFLALPLRRSWCWIQAWQVVFDRVCGKGQSSPSRCVSLFLRAVQRLHFQLSRRWQKDDCSLCSPSILCRAWNTSQNRVRNHTEASACTTCPTSHPWDKDHTHHMLILVPMTLDCANFAVH